MHILKGVVFFFFLCVNLVGKSFATDFYGDGEARGSHPYILMQDSVIDMGVIHSGERATGHIHLINGGAYDLIIANVRSSCGILVRSWPDKAISAGEEAEIHFRYDSNKIGPFTRLITIHTNAWQKSLVVTVRGEVIP